MADGRNMSILAFPKARCFFASQPKNNEVAFCRAEVAGKYAKAAGEAANQARPSPLRHPFRAIISNGAIRPAEMFSIMLRTLAWRRSPISMCRPSGSGPLPDGVFALSALK